jgi:hypothetical protein
MRVLAPVIASGGVWDSRTSRPYVLAPAMLPCVALWQLQDALRKAGLALLELRRCVGVSMHTSPDKLRTHARVARVGGR